MLLKQIMVWRIIFPLVFFNFIFGHVTGQSNMYYDSLVSYQKHYINTLEVIGKNDRKYIRFYPVDKSYRVEASFTKIDDTQGFYMSTASGVKQKYFQYGLLAFNVNNSSCRLYIYQSATLLQQEKYKDYLFVPFGDATSGFTSYGGGRYLDFTISDIKNSHLIIDFNKAYNPYCAYTTGYNCPIPPKENLLNIPVPAGEKNYGKPVH
jgi:uncharacterized protein